MDMGKGADMSWEDIQNEFDIMNRMSCRPVGLQKVPGNHIFDEDQSVKWNREQVELNNKKYQSEVARLNTEKNKARDSVYNLIIEKIQYEVGHRLSRKKAEAIWNRAYEDGHSFGFYSKKSVAACQTLLIWRLLCWEVISNARAFRDTQRSCHYGRGLILEDVSD